MGMEDMTFSDCQSLLKYPKPAYHRNIGQLLCVVVSSELVQTVLLCQQQISYLSYFFE